VTTAAIFLILLLTAGVCGYVIGHSQGQSDLAKKLRGPR
jgi:hypothetical protein